MGTTTDEVTILFKLLGAQDSFWMSEQGGAVYARDIQE